MTSLHAQSSVQAETPRSNRRSGRAALVAGGLAAAAAGCLGVVLVGVGGETAAPVASCADRQAYLDLSSSVRTNPWRELAVGALHEAAVSSLVCRTPFVAYGIIGGGRVVEVVSTDAIADLSPAGPNEKVRASHLSSADRRVIRDRVSGRLDDVLAVELDAASQSTISALYAAASEHATPNTDIIIFTDGVNQDEDIDLNRPLNAGDGAAAARAVEVRPIGNRQTTVVGLGQSDAINPPPGGTWLQEIRAFNEALCSLSGAQACRIFTSATVSETLAVPTQEKGE